MASVFDYEKSGKRFWGFTIYLGRDPETGKKRNTKRRGFTTKRAATTAANRMQYKKDNGELGKTHQRMVFKDVAEEYWLVYVKKVRNTTAIGVRTLVDKYVLPSLGEYLIQAITPAIIENALGKWSQAMPALFMRAFNFVEQVFRYAINNDYATKDPTTKVERPRVAKKAKDDELLYWNAEQVSAFFQCIDPNVERENYTMFRVLFMTGLRRGELLGLRWKNINLLPGQESVSVESTLVANGVLNPPKTESSYRTVPIRDVDTIDTLKKWRDEQASNATVHGLPSPNLNSFVFASVEGQPHHLSWPDRLLKRIINDNNLKPRITVHKARHSFITNLLLAGVPVPVVQHLVGHKTPTITLMVYSHVSTSAGIQAVSTLSEYLKDNQGTDSQKDSQVVSMSTK